MDRALLWLCWHRYLQKQLHRQASCVEKMQISQNESPLVPGLPSAHTSLLCFYTCLVFPVSSLPWDRKLFLHATVYETFSRHSFRAACRCSFFACQLPQKAKATPRGRCDCSANPSTGTVLKLDIFVTAPNNQLIHSLTLTGVVDR